MKEEYQSLELVRNAEKERFEMHVDNQLAVIEYKQSPTAIYLTHTEVPLQLEGKGVASAIIEKALAYIQQANMKLVPLCPFVAGYLKRHPEWNTIIDERVNITD